MRFILLIVAAAAGAAGAAAAVANAELQNNVLVIAPCAPGGVSSRQRFCDRTLSFEDRAAALYKALNATERMGQLNLLAAGATRPDEGVLLPPLNMGGEALHGLWSTCVINICPTQFPSPLHLGASFNKRIWRAVGNITSVEARALFATSRGKGLEGTLGLTYYTPNINLLRDPRWGRAEEVPSEDPFLNGLYGRYFVKGFQSTTPEGYRRANAVVKHAFVYNLEVDTDAEDAQAGVDRHRFNAIVSPRELAESYLSQFRDVVVQNNDADPPAGIMCAYNAINGVPACLNAALLRETLRDAFGFRGIVASDCGAIRDAFENHKYTDSLGQAIRLALDATVDSNCGKAYSNIPELVANGTLTEHDFRASVERVLESRLRLGLLDGIADLEVSLDAVDSAEHRETALRAAREGIVLLQNNNDSLPLKRSASIALIGPQANATRNMLSGYHGSPPFLISPLDAIRRAAGSAVTYARGVNITGSDTSGIRQAVAIAKQADAVVVGIGLCGNNDLSDADDTCQSINESEGIDRTNTSLPYVQRSLLDALLEIKDRPPIVVFVMAAGSLDLGMLKGQTNVSILWVGYPGQAGGQAISDVLFGDVSPSGRLPFTMYRDDYVETMSYEDMSLFAQTPRTYKFLDNNDANAVVFPFGASLSYTSFSTILTDHGANHASIVVENVGGATGASAILVFARYLGDDDAPASFSPIPKRLLVAFDKTPLLRPGQRWHTTLPLDALSYVDASGKRSKLPGPYALLIDTAAGPDIEFRFHRTSSVLDSPVSIDR